MNQTDLQLSQGYIHFINHFFSEVDHKEVERSDHSSSMDSSSSSTENLGKILNSSFSQVVTLIRKLSDSDALPPQFYSPSPIAFEQIIPKWAHEALQKRLNLAFANSMPLDRALFTLLSLYKGGAMLTEIESNSPNCQLILKMLSSTAEGWAREVLLTEREWAREELVNNEEACLPIKSVPFEQAQRAFRSLYESQLLMDQINLTGQHVELGLKTDSPLSLRHALHIAELMVRSTFWKPTYYDPEEGRLFRNEMPRVVCVVDMLTIKGINLHKNSVDQLQKSAESLALFYLARKMGIECTQKLCLDFTEIRKVIESNEEVRAQFNENATRFSTPKARVEYLERRIGTDPQHEESSTYNSSQTYLLTTVNPPQLRQYKVYTIAVNALMRYTVNASVSKNGYRPVGILLHELTHTLLRKEKFPYWEPEEGLSEYVKWWSFIHFFGMNEDEAEQYHIDESNFMSYFRDMQKRYGSDSDLSEVIETYKKETTNAIRDHLASEEGQKDPNRLHLSKQLDYWSNKFMI